MKLNLQSSSEGPSVSSAPDWETMPTLEQRLLDDFLRRECGHPEYDMYWQGRECKKCARRSESIRRAEQEERKRNTRTVPELLFGTTAHIVLGEGERLALPYPRHGMIAHVYGIGDEKPRATFRSVPVRLPNGAGMLCYRAWRRDGCDQPTDPRDPFGEPLTFREAACIYSASFVRSAAGSSPD